MDFTAYIANLPSGKRALLYRSPWTSLAVFRNLPPLAQAYVMRLLFLPGPFPMGGSGAPDWRRMRGVRTTHACSHARAGGRAGSEQGFG